MIARRSALGAVTSRMRTSSLSVPLPACTVSEAKVPPGMAMGVVGENEKPARPRRNRGAS